MTTYIKYFTQNKRVIEVENSKPKKGGEGEVFLTVKGRPADCAKILFTHARTSDKMQKILSMVSNPPQMLRGLNYVICWPKEALFDTRGEFVGFLMDKAFAGSELLYELVTSKIRLSKDWHVKYDRSKRDGIVNRLKLCVNLTIAIHSIHRSNRYVLVDLKPQNLLITRDGKISLIDLDSIQISTSGKVNFNAKVVTPEYTPKEGERLDPSTNYIPVTWDRFCLSVIIYEVLFGIHPYTSTAIGQYAEKSTILEKIRANLFVHGSKKNYLSVIPAPHNNFNIIPQSLKTLFYNSFELGAKNPNLRPTAEEWGRTITEELKKNSLSNFIMTSSTTQPTNTNSDEQYQIVSKPKPEPSNAIGWIIGTIIMILFYYFVLFNGTW